MLYISPKVLVLVDKFLCVISSANQGASYHTVLSFLSSIHTIYIQYILYYMQIHPQTHTLSHSNTQSQRHTTDCKHTPITINTTLTNTTHSYYKHALQTHTMHTAPENLLRFVWEKPAIPLFPKSQDGKQKFKMNRKEERKRNKMNEWNYEQNINKTMHANQKEHM